MKSPSPNRKPNFNPRSQYRERHPWEKDGTVEEIYFNPRSQYRERHKALIYGDPDEIFQSTLPIQGATHMIRARIEELMDFNPRSQYRERRMGS